MIKAKTFWALLIGGTVFFMVAPVHFMRLIMLLSMVMILVSALVMLLTFRKSKKLSMASLWISTITSFIAFFIYQAILPALVPGHIVAVAMVAGGMLGTGWAAATDVYCEEGIVKRRGNPSYLLVWAIIFSFTQLGALFWGRPLRWALVVLGISTGVVVGNSLGLMVASVIARRRAKALPMRLAL